MATTKVIKDLTDLNQANSESGLRMPTGGAFSGTPAEGMMRNDTTQDSEGSASTMQHYTGDNVWKNFVNVALPPTVYSFDLTNPTVSATKSVPVSYGNTRGTSMPADGTALYTTSLSGGNDYLHKYPLSTAYDVSSLGSATTYQTTVTIPDYLGGVIVNNDQSIIAYDPYSTSSWYVQSFGTNGDISSLQTASTYTCSRGGGDLVARSMIYADSQNKMYWMNTQMRKFDLTTAGDPSSGPQCPTAIPNTTDSDFSSDMDGGNTRSLAFNTDGTQLTIMGDSSRLAQYTLSTAWDITTRGSATKFNFTTLLGGSYDLFGLFPNADYTKAVLTAGEQNIIFSLSL